MERTYLGDGVYGYFNGYNVELSTRNGIETTNRIVLDPDVLSSFLVFVQSLKNQDICGFCGLPGADKVPHPVRWPAENSACTEYVHAECEDRECLRASDLCQGKEREDFLRTL